MAEIDLYALYYADDHRYRDDVDLDDDDDIDFDEVHEEISLENRRQKALVDARLLLGMKPQYLKHIGSLAQKALSKHTAKFASTVESEWKEWVETCEKLLKSAYAEQARREEYEENLADYDDMADDTLVSETWEKRLAVQKAARNKLSGWDKKYTAPKLHRSGLKRDKAKLWQREPTRRRKHQKKQQSWRLAKKAKLLRVRLSTPPASQPQE